LVVENEDSLVNFILDIDESGSSLLDYVRYDFLSLPGISTFCDRIDYRSITAAIWSSLSLRLKGTIDNKLRLRRCSWRSIPLESTIVNELPPIFSGFRDKTSHFYIGGVAMDLQVHHFTVGVMGNRILSRLSKR
jgi:hypothetical protein